MTFTRRITRRRAAQAARNYARRVVEESAVDVGQVAPQIERLLGYVWARLEDPDSPQVRAFLGDDPRHIFTMALGPTMEARQCRRGRDLLDPDVHEHFLQVALTRGRAMVEESRRGTVETADDFADVAGDVLHRPVPDEELPALALLSYGMLWLYLWDEFADVPRNERKSVVKIVWGWTAGSTPEGRTAAMGLVSSAVAVALALHWDVASPWPNDRLREKLRGQWVGEADDVLDRAYASRDRGGDV